MVAVPALTPLTTPVPAPTVAIDALLLVHVPPVAVLVNVVVAPAHTLLPPLIAAGAAFTVIVLVAEHPDAAYVMVAVPGATAETTPVLLMVAMAVLLLLHVPPAVASVSVVAVPAHNTEEPVMAATEQPDTVMFAHQVSHTLAVGLATSWIVQKSFILRGSRQVDE
jgi:hypothetical protein